MRERRRPPCRWAPQEQAGHGARMRPMTGLALLAWDGGMLSYGLDLAREAVGRPARGRHRQPRAVLAAMLIDLWLLDEAEAVMEDASAEAVDEPAWTAEIGVLRARLCLATGRFDRVAEHAEAALATARALNDRDGRDDRDDRGDQDGRDHSDGRGGLGGRDASGLVTSGLTCSALSVLGVASLRAGDLPGAVRHMEREPARWSWGMPAYTRLRSELAAGRIAEARTGAAGAMGSLGGVYAALPRHTATLTGEPAAAAWLVRVAMAAGEPGRADAVVEAAEGLAGRNPGLPGPPVAADHARGLREGDAEALGRAVAGYADPWARGSAAEDLGVLLGAGGRHGEPAMESLRTALTCYGAVGATRDAARVRGRLRLLGERRRHWSRTDRPVSGWASLTGTERAVCDLVAQGLTNRNAAGQLFISEHTVAFHLRQVFRKLGIRSRVELARLAAQEDGDRDGRSLH
ncbi:helix-turn-helix transcriptional regulator [Streptosporangium sp. NPDC023615]|uniref:helix-turn-helix transcriptional regulator n=1 Tax=Streptosporangium sp. NPDC023615 TaxID=3154794 RepID=UPI003427A052